MNNERALGGFALCCKCHKRKRYIYFRAVSNRDSVCHECKIKYLRTLNNKQKHDLKYTLEYKYIFDNLNTKPYYNCVVSVKMFEELCCIDGRFKHINKTFHRGGGFLDVDAYILTNDKHYEWLVG